MNFYSEQLKNLKFSFVRVFGKISGEIFLDKPHKEFGDVH